MHRRIQGSIWVGSLLVVLASNILLPCLARPLRERSGNNSTSNGRRQAEIATRVLPAEAEAGVGASGASVSTNTLRQKASSFKSSGGKYSLGQEISPADAPPQPPPGPFKNIVFIDDSLQFKLSRGGSVFLAPLTATINGLAFPVVSIKKAGIKLTLAGSPGGSSLASLFPNGGTVELAITNGDGARIDCVLTRQGESVSVLNAAGTPVLAFNAVLSDGTTTPVRLEILQPNGGARIDASATTWIVIHGRLDSSGTSEIQALAAAIKNHAIKNQRSNDQVLLLDWESAARETAVFGLFSNGEQWIQPVGRAAASALMHYGFAGSKINLVGHSWGAYVADELAEGIQLAEGINGGVDVIVALDPAASTIGSEYNPNDRGTIDFRTHSKFSVAFHSSRAFGNENTPGRAHEAFSVGFQLDPASGLVETQQASELERHSWIRNFFTSLISGTGGISGLFTLERLL